MNNMDKVCHLLELKLFKKFNILKKWLNERQTARRCCTARFAGKYDSCHPNCKKL